MLSFNILLRIGVGLLGAFFLVIGLQWLVIPDDMAAQFSIQLVGIHGMSTGRGDLGGLFVGMAVMTFLGLQRRNDLAPGMLISVTIILGAIALGRVFGFIIDGISMLTFALFLLEIIFMALYIGVARQLVTTIEDSD